MLEVQQHTFCRADGSALTIRSTTGEGLSVIEMVEEPAPQEALEPSDEVAA